MQINVNTDRTIENHQGLDEHVETVLRAAIGRFEDYLTGVEVHLTNENREKHADGGNGCTMEARVRGYQPVVVHDHADDLRQSIKNASGKLARALDSTIGRLNDKGRREAPPVEAVPDALADKNLTSGV